MNRPAGFSGHSRLVVGRLSPHGAFSLVEVIFALGIASLALVSILALLPVGLQSSRDSVEESSALNILSSIIADRRATSFTSPSLIYKLPALTTAMPVTTNIFGVASNDQVTPLGTARYRVTSTLTPPPVGTLNPYTADLKASWPALSTNSPASVEVVVTFPQP